MESLFSKVSLVDIQQDFSRNIVSPREPQGLFDDLSKSPSDMLLAQRVEVETKPPFFRSDQPIIDRPFEDSAWFNAIEWPFQNWQSSRFSKGRHGVWYGSDCIETSAFESAYNWYKRLLCDAGFENHSVIAERSVYSVACSAALLELRRVVDAYPDLLHASDYTFCQALGNRINREGHPGLITLSVRRPGGENVAIFNPSVLSSPKLVCQLTYRLDNGTIEIEQQRGEVWITLEAQKLR